MLLNDDHTEWFKRRWRTDQGKIGEPGGAKRGEEGLYRGPGVFGARAQHCSLTPPHDRSIEPGRKHEPMKWLAHYCV